MEAATVDRIAASALTAAGDVIGSLGLAACREPRLRNAFTDHLKTESITKRLNRTTTTAY